MGFKRVSAGGTPPAATTKGIAPTAQTAPAEEAAPVEEQAAAAEPAKAPTRTRVKPKAEAAAPATPARILTAAERAALAAKEAKAAPAEDAAQEEADADDLSWTYGAEEGAAKAAEIAAEKQEAREKKRERGYWPIRFGLIPPSPEHPDRYQADIIILDATVGPLYYEHTLRNSRTGFWDVYEPCPKEKDSCPLCPPNGERASQFVMLLTVLNINGFTYRRGAKAGQHIPITKDLLVPLAGDHPFFHELMKEHGSLRGIQLTMTRKDRYDPQIGKPTFVGKFDDEQIEAYIKSQGMWVPKITREGEKIADEDHMMHPYKYGEFLHKPSGADLRARYANGGAAPIGSTAGSDSSQWGGSRFQPNVAGGPALDDLDDDLPF